MLPVDSCTFDTIPDPYPGGVSPCTLPWDHSSLSVEGFCENDSIYFIIYNTGNPLTGDMDCWAPVRIIVDGVLLTLDSLMIAGGDSVVYVFPGDGRTWRLEADQHPLHPGNSHPNATVESCGDTQNWTPGFVNILPQDDADPFVDIYCGVTVSSFDPNDKTGYPLGISSEHFIYRNQQMQYVVRFQNTGTDTAFNIIIRDTLDSDLDIATVTPGVASHPYTFNLVDSLVLEWIFPNIMLPDSNVNEPESNGFLTYTVNPKENLSDWTSITNRANIFFDYNPAIITNTTVHVVNSLMHILTDNESTFNDNNNSCLLYPNPADKILNIYFKNEDNREFSIVVFDICGKAVMNFPASESTMLDVSALEPGFYSVRISGNKLSWIGKVIIE